MSHLALAAWATNDTKDLARSTLSACEGNTGQLATLAVRRGFGAVWRTSTSSKKTTPSFDTQKQHQAQHLAIGAGKLLSASYQSRWFSNRRGTGRSSPLHPTPN